MPDRGGGAEEARIEDGPHVVPRAAAGDLTAKEALLLAELDGLGRTIANAKREIARLKVDDITDRHIPAATDELDAIVQHTAAATNEILDCCEVLESLAGRLPEAIAAATLQGAITRIYEACSFQDITGQRIGKVVAALKAIEMRVAVVTGRFEPEPEEGEPTDGQRLAHGPQRPGTGVSQADIDRLLAGS
ncbi:protein phosphatase CheZ [Falsiroseomonas oryziterrae]|uniref:protein phosphatase CheZ n=1 Tax=Falsiroseomonas oryziterrae TaxID=2911368 RepID=UPI001F417F1F|nr:protein phosphatase CheZ [Roseomonas sp. NPKOSM-4]